MHLRALKFTLSALVLISVFAGCSDSRPPEGETTTPLPAEQDPSNPQSAQHPDAAAGENAP